jgi:hypothetical protein
MADGKFAKTQSSDDFNRLVSSIEEVVHDAQLSQAVIALELVLARARVQQAKFK